MRKLKNDLTNKRFGKWVVLKYYKDEYYFCLCDCGILRAVLGGSLVRGRSNSCGCKHSPDYDEYDEQTRKRLLKSIEVDENNCWNWKLYKTKSGYGTTNYRKKVGQRAHRVSWLVNRGEIPNDYYVLHKCDNPACINPEHLFLGTHTENMKDMKEKGRACKGENSHLHRNNRKKNG